MRQPRRSHLVLPRQNSRTDNSRANYRGVTGAARCCARQRGRRPPARSRLPSGVNKSRREIRDRVSFKVLRHTARLSASFSPSLSLALSPVFFCLSLSRALRLKQKFTRNISSNNSISRCIIYARCERNSGLLHFLLTFTLAVMGNLVVLYWVFLFGNWK